MALSDDLRALLMAKITATDDEKQAALQNINYQFGVLDGRKAAYNEFLAMLLTEAPPSDEGSFDEEHDRPRDLDYRDTQ